MIAPICNGQIRFGSSGSLEAHRVPDRRQRLFCRPSAISYPSTLEVVAFRGSLGSRERLVVGFRDPFAETVSDRVEVPPATHSTGVKPQFGLLFQLLNLFRAQTADALF
jgi:hypothetical protein